MKRTIYFISVMLVLACISFAASAQQNNTRTGYFLDDYTYGYRQNPSFSPEKNFVAIPVLGNLSFGADSDVALSNFLYPSGNGKLALFIDDSVSEETFLESLKDDNQLNTNLNLTLLAAGFRTGCLYHTIDVSMRATQNATLPKSLFGFIKVGTANGDTSWLIEDVGLGLETYGEVAYGLSADIGESLHIGARLKFLLGMGYVDMNIDKLNISMTEEHWKASTYGSLNASGLFTFDTASDNTVDLMSLGLDMKNMKSNAFGFGFDLGISYDFLDYFTASVSLLDMGFISWKDMTQASSTGTSSYYFDGFGTISDGEDIQNQLEGMKDEILSLVQLEKDGVGNKIKRLSATLYTGIEAKMPFYDRLSFGLLGTHRFNGAYSWTEGRLAANLTPIKSIGIAASYAISNFGNSFGGILNFTFPGLNFFVGMDSFIPMFNISPQGIPVENMNTSLALGFNVTFGKGR